MVLGNTEVIYTGKPAPYIDAITAKSTVREEAAKVGHGDDAGVGGARESELRF